MLFLKKYWHQQTGATAIEYGLIAAGIGVAVMIVVFSIGTDLGAYFQFVSDMISSTSS